MSESLSYVKESKKPSIGCSIFKTNNEFHPTNKPSPVFTNGGGSGDSANFPKENLNSNSNYSQKSNSNGRVLMEKNQCGGDGDGLDPELSFRTTFRKIGAGLQNLGNTCFLNSVLQCLTYTEPFAAYLQSGRHKSSCISRNFCYARQEDAHEYMVNLLESMHKCCLPSGFPSESSVAYEKSLVHKIFGGRLRSQVRCMECSNGSNKYDPFLDLSLEIAKADSLREALIHFTDVEQLDGGEREYQCQRCQHKVKAVRQLTIHKAPYVLTIHLKRFGSFLPGHKINKEVRFSPILDLKPFSSGPYEGGLKYTLYGVLVHAGWSTHSGHYYCYVRTSSGTWYLLDDDEVFEVSETDVLKQKAYMLFYVRDRKNHAPKKPVDILRKGSNTPVSAPNLTKSNTMPSDSMKESISENSSLRTHLGTLVEGPVVAIGSLESSLKKVFDSVQHSIINHISGESLPHSDSSVVEGGGTVSHSSSASSDPKTEAINEPEESKVTNSHATSENLPEIDSSVVKSEDIMSHPPGPKNNNMCEDNKTIKDLTGSVVTLSDCNVQEFCSTATNMEHENASLIETEFDKEASKKVSGLGSDEVDLMQLSSQSGTEESLCKNLGEMIGPVVKSDGILSPFTGAKVEDKFEHNEIMKSGPVAVFPDCNALQGFVSKTSATDMEIERASVIAMDTSTAVSKEVSELASNEVDSVQLSSLSGTEESFSKASELSNSVDESNSIMSHPIDKSVEDINEQKETIHTPCLSGIEGSLSTGSELTISVDRSNSIMSHPIDKTAEDINEQKETMNNLTWSSFHTPSLSGTEGSLSTASESTIPVDKSDSILSHPIDKTAEDINEQKETMHDLTGPISTIPDCIVSITSDVDMEVVKASVIEMEPKKALSIEVSERGVDEVDLVQLSSQLGTKESLSKEVSALGPEIVGIVPLSSQLGIEKAVCESVGDVGPEEADSKLVSQSDAEEAICKGVNDFGPGEANLVQVSNQLGTEEVCKSISNSGSGEGDSMTLISQSDAGEAICKGVTDFGPGEANLVQVSNQLGTEEVCKSNSNSGSGEGDSMTLTSQSDAEEAICKGVSDFGPGEANLVQVSNQLGTEEVCKSISDLGSGESDSMTLTNRQNTEDDENGDILNEGGTSFKQNAEENGYTSVESLSVDTLIQSSMTSRCEQKEVLNNFHCQKVLKPKKQLKKFQVIHLRSSLLFRTPSWICRKKKNKRSRNQGLERSKSIKIGESSKSGLEPSTSEQTRTVAFDSSLSRKRKGNSGACNTHDRKFTRDDSRGDSSTKLVQVELRERSGLNRSVLAMPEAPVKRSCSTLTSNSCHYKESDISQDRRSSVQNFMNMLTRGLEETTGNCISLFLSSLIFFNRLSLYCIRMVF
ncbi:hypothetical protein AQUCO_01600225v1 [Aquilegia coerulea]|uniref:USP domain-containing protein n=1 Tax=Aquilegia coerulea TaxID=218851 RepID=A0A2G5DQR3_AQUCA|nr:hypothetical protein AQUCO_01600225v1 [Aquilegia coerulea]